jgi:hypothetical protein
MEERRKRRQREQEEDRVDREAELEERRAAGFLDEDDEMQDAKRIKQEHEGTDVRLEVKEEADPIMQAMLEAAKAPSSTPPHAMLPGAASPVTPPEDAKAEQQPSGPAAAPPGFIAAGPAAAAVRPGRALAFGTRAKPVLNALFGEEEEEQTTKRKLVPLQYSEEELHAVQDHSVAMAAAAAGAAAAAAGGGPGFGAGASEQDSQLKLRKIMDNIPVTTDGVYK